MDSKHNKNTLLQLATDLMRCPKNDCVVLILGTSFIGIGSVSRAGNSTVWHYQQSP